MRQCLTTLFKLPYIGDLLCYVVYAQMSSITPLMMWFHGCERMQCGTSVIWMPKDTRQVVERAVELLRGSDSEMFFRFTMRQSLLIYYAGDDESVINVFGHVFGMHRRYLDLGPQGVVCFIVQSLFVSAAAPRFNQYKVNDRERAALKSVSRKMLEWLSQHSFDAAFIALYQTVVERQIRKGVPKE